MARDINEPVARDGLYHKFLRYEGCTAEGKLIVSDTTYFAASAYWSQHWQDETYKRYIRKTEQIVNGAAYVYHIIDAPSVEQAQAIAVKFHTKRYTIHIDTTQLD